MPNAQALAWMQGLFFFLLLDKNAEMGIFFFSPAPVCVCFKILFFSCVRVTPYIIHIYVYTYIINNTYICIYIQYDIYIKYDIHINTIILSCKRINQYRHIDTTPSIQKTHTAKNNMVYDDFNYIHSISKLEN